MELQEERLISSGSQQETDGTSNGIMEENLIKALLTKMEVGLRETKKG